MKKTSKKSGALFSPQRGKKEAHLFDFDEPVKKEKTKRIGKRRGARGARQPRTTTRYGGGRYGSALGSGVWMYSSPRNQRCATPIKIQKSGGSSWSKHGAYLQRNGAQREGQGVGFDTHEQEVNLPTTLGQWQREGDQYMFQIVLSPEHAKEVDLQAFARSVMKAVERDLKTPLEWVGMDHTNTKQHHVHIALRGRGPNGEPLEIAKSYLFGGLSARAGDVLTQELGWRLEPELEKQRQRELQQDRFGQHDKAIRSKLDGQDRVQDRDLTKDERKRLRKLAERGLAWEKDGVWEMAFQWKEKMIDRHEQTFQHERAERKQERKREERQPERERGEERQQERQRTLVRIIDDQRERTR